MASTYTQLGCLLLTVLTVASASAGAAALAGTADAQANEQLQQEGTADGSPVTVTPGLAGITNDFTFTMNLSGNSSDVEVESA